MWINATRDEIKTINKNQTWNVVLLLEENISIAIKLGIQSEAPLWC